jgi:hypothetical protein
LLLLVVAVLLLKKLNIRRNALVKALNVLMQNDQIHGVTRERQFVGVANRDTVRHPILPGGCGKNSL